MAEAAIYLACKEGGIPRSAEEIEHSSDGHDGKEHQALLEGAAEGDRPACVCP